jgi:hypothetical protein
MTKITGGGVQGSFNRKVDVRVGSRTTQVVNPAGVSQLGAAQGGRINDGNISGINSSKAVFEAPRNAATRIGNDEAAATTAGPGGSRTVYRAGYQGKH